MSLLESETIKPVVETLDTASPYEDFTLLRDNDRGRQFLAAKAGKRFLLKTTATDSGKALSMLKREYELSIGLSHPGIAYVFTYEPVTEIGPCIVMEYVDGRSLDEFLSENPDRAQRKKVFGQILDAVEYIHSRGITHNDLSPQNILVTKSGNNVKLIDFGFADDDCHYLTHSMGCTRQYASPELLSGEKVGIASDIWSLGTLLSEIFRNDICKYKAVASKCHKRDISSRYHSVQELRNAWIHYFTPAYCTAGLLVAVILALCAYDFIQQRNNYVQQKAEYEKIVQAKREKDELLEKAKAEVNEWYENEIPAFRSAMQKCKSVQELSDLHCGLIEKYNNLWPEILHSYPEDIRNDISFYMGEKCNTDFPQNREVNEYKKKILRQ